MGYLMAFIIGGLIGIFIISICAMAKDDADREEMIQRLKDEIRAEMMEDEE